MIIDRSKIKNKSAFSMQIGSIFEKGYGIVSKLIMQDTRLSIESKAIYAYLCSYAGAGNEAYPSIPKILHDLDISKSRLYKHMDILVDAGYVIKHRTQGENNLMGHNVYEIVFVIDKDNIDNSTDTDNITNIW